MIRGITYAEEKADEVLEEGGIAAPPVPVEKLASMLGADLAYAPFEGEVSGMLARGEDGAPPLIGVNSAHANTRQRFTVAHEVAHLVMHPGTPMFIDRFVRVNWRNGESNLEEIEANAFAAQLLMPKKLVLDLVAEVVAAREQITPDALAGQLAKNFQVSPLAMSYRLENLGILDPSGLID
jgi:Zn-dependent peptidase ImmA (M78 family)